MFLLSITGLHCVCKCVHMRALCTSIVYMGGEGTKRCDGCTLVYGQFISNVGQDSLKGDGVLEHPLTSSPHNNVVGTQRDTGRKDSTLDHDHTQ